MRCWCDPGSRCLLTRPDPEISISATEPSAMCPAVRRHRGDTDDNAVESEGDHPSQNTPRMETAEREEASAPQGARSRLAFQTSAPSSNMHESQQYAEGCQDLAMSSSDCNVSFGLPKHPFQRHIASEAAR